MTSPLVKPRVSARWRAGTALLAFSLGIAACGTTETSTTPTLATQAPASAEPESTEAPTTEAPSVGSETTESASTDTTEPETVEEDEVAAPAVNLFPDIDVLNIADGATVNLATELGGFDKATLLWFFAPH